MRGFLICGRCGKEARFASEVKQGGGRTAACKTYAYVHHLNPAEMRGFLICERCGKEAHFASKVKQGGGRTATCKTYDHVHHLNPAEMRGFVFSLSDVAVLLLLSSPFSIYVIPECLAARRVRGAVVCCFLFRFPIKTFGNDEKKIEPSFKVLFPRVFLVWSSPKAVIGDLLCIHFLSLLLLNHVIPESCRRKSGKQFLILN